MISNTDFEKLWFLYQTDGVQKDVSITSFYKLVKTEQTVTAKTAMLLQI